MNTTEINGTTFVLENIGAVGPIVVDDKSDLWGNASFSVWAGGGEVRVVYAWDAAGDNTQDAQTLIADYDRSKLIRYIRNPDLARMT